jgi:hypothetical protein
LLPDEIQHHIIRQQRVHPAAGNADYVKLRTIIKSCCRYESESRGGLDRIPILPDQVNVSPSADEKTS